ncbi:MAG: Wzz/FepE/Etk N-terminal domain-containing protein [Flavobacteriales bacterium]
MNFISLIRLLWDNKITLVSVTVVAAVASIIVSFMIEEKYRSTVVMFPAETSSLSGSVLNTESESKGMITRFGKEDRALSLIQLLKSEQIFGRIKEKYKLGKHYEIDSLHPHRSSAIKKKYESLVNFERTKYGSVKISVLDEDPDTAALIANDISALVDSVKNRMQRDRALEALNVVKRDLREIEGYISNLEDSLTFIRHKGVQNYESQAEMFNEQIAMAMRKGKESALHALKKEMDTLALYGTPYVSLNMELEEALFQYGKLKRRYQQIKADANSTISHKFVMDRAYPADRKAYPIRWLIVSSSTLGTFLIMIFVIIGKIKVKEAIQKRGQWEKTDE